MHWDEMGGGRKEAEAAFLGLLLPSRPVPSHGKEGRRLWLAVQGLQPGPGEAAV